jgi:poly(A)-specific ribonuclease
VAPGEGCSELRSKFLKNRDRRFMCQAESLRFVAQHDFDFNVWIKQGCGYISRQEEATCRARITAEHSKKLNDGRDENLSQDARVFTELMSTVAADVRRCVESDSVQAALQRGGAGVEAVKAVFSQDNVVLTADMPSFVTKEYDSFRRKIIHNDIAPQFPEFLFETVDEDDAGDNPRRRGKCIRVALLGPPPAVQTAKMERVNAWAARQQRAVTNAVGVRHIIDAISTAGLPIVGHSCYLDLMHIYFKFIGDLPPPAGRLVLPNARNFPRCV